MPSRQFRDANGVQWDVWDVHPKDAIARHAYDRRGTDRDGESARRAGERGSYLDPTLEEGWLCFQAGLERRRFAPIPPAWFELPDAVLRVMLDIASPVLATPPISRPATPESR